MLTYITLAVPFLLLVLLVDTLVLKTWVVKQRGTGTVMLIMLAFTLVFDQLLTGLPVVLYEETLLSGVRLGYAPIEDFTYTIAAVIGIGSLASYEAKR